MERDRYVNLIHRGQSLELVNYTSALERQTGILSGPLSSDAINFLVGSISPRDFLMFLKSLNLFDSPSLPP